MALRFTLDKVPTPVKGRTLPGEGSDIAARKAPKTTDLIVQGPRPPLVRRLRDNADCEVTVCKVTDDARLVWQDVRSDGQLLLWQAVNEKKICRAAALRDPSLA